MNTRTGTIIRLAMAALAAMISTAGAADITFEGHVSWNKSAGIGIIDARSFDKLVVVVTGEHHFPNNLSGDVTGVTYNNQTLIKAVEVNPADPATGGHGQTATDIWYLDDPGAYDGTGEIAVTFNGNSWVATAIGLSKTADGVSAIAALGGSASVDLTTTVPGSIVISNIGMGGQGNTADVQNVHPNSPSNVIEIDSLRVSSYAGHVVARTSLAGTGTETYSFSTTKTDVATIAAAFEPAVTDPNLPDVTAGDSWVTWSGQAVTLDPVVVNNDSQVPQRPLTHVWSADPATLVSITEDGVNPDDPSTEGAVVTVTKSGNTGDATVVTLTLSVTLDGQEETVQDSLWLDVYDNACAASEAVSGSGIFDPADFNKDCITDISDLAEMLIAWLDDYSLTVPTEAP